MTGSEKSTRQSQLMDLTQLWISGKLKKSIRKPTWISILNIGQKTWFSFWLLFELEKFSKVNLFLQESELDFLEDSEISKILCNDEFSLKVGINAWEEEEEETSFTTVRLASRNYSNRFFNTSELILKRIHGMWNLLARKQTTPFKFKTNPFI